MTQLLDVVLRSSAIVVVALLALPFLRRRAAALRHGVLAAALMASALVAPLYWALPALTVRVPAARAPAAMAVEASGPRESLAITATPSPFPLMPLIAGAWAAGAVVSFGLLLVALGRVRRLAADATPVTDGAWSRIAREVTDAIGLRRPVTLLQSDQTDTLATWGVRRPRILLPAHARHWSDARIHAVIRHELAHVQRRDWLVQVAAEGLRAVYWFNPIVGLACRRLRRESEQACDDAVLRAGVSAADYATHLVDVARNCRGSALPVAAVMPMARPSTLERRIAAMLNPRLGRQALSVRAIAITSVVLLACALPIAAFRVAQEGPLPLSGVIYDPTGGVLPEVALTLEDERQNKWQTTSDSTGHFEFSPVSAGKYMLGASLQGFRPLQQSLVLHAARDWTRAVTLQVGAVQESITVSEKRPKPSARGAQSVSPAPIRVGGNIRPPTKTRDVHPVYPPSMREAGREGRVPLEAIIGRDGAVVSVRVATAQVHPDFAQAAIDAVEQWRFTPTLLNGKPVEVVMTVSVDFELKD